MTMRVLVLGCREQPETFLARLFRGLSANGVEVLLATARRPRGHVDGWRETWVPTRGRGRRAALKRSTWRVSHPRDALRRPSPLRAKAVRDLRPDLLYFPWNGGAIYDEELFDLGIPTVVSCRGSHVLVVPTGDDRPGWEDGLRRTFDKAAAVHCVSEHIAAAAQRYGLAPEKASVIQPAVDPDAFPPAVTDRRSVQLRLVTTGSLTWRKGHEYAVAALADLRSQGVEATLTIIGAGDDFPRVRFTAVDLGVEAHVHMAGAQPPSAVLESLQGADVFWLSSLEEGISNAVLEAMACGLPVVTTDAGGMREAVTDGVEGFVVDRRDVNRMAQRTAELAHDPRMREQMAAAARDRVVRDFNLDDQIAAFIELFERAIASGTR